MPHPVALAKNAERKQQLKKEICDYFTDQGVDRETLIKLCAAIVSDAEKAFKGYGISEPGTFTQSKVAPRHRAKVELWVSQLVDILDFDRPEIDDSGESEEDYWDRTDDIRAYQ